MRRVEGATCCGCNVLRVQRVARDLMCIRLPEGSNHHWWVEAYLCMSRRVQCVVLGPCTRAGRPMNMGRMCYVLCWALHTCRSTYEYGSYVLCVVLAPAYVQVDL